MEFGSTTARLLVVDDEPELRALLQEYFGRQGYAVEGAADAELARRCLERFAPQIVILDVNLPGEDGFALARSLRVRYPRLGILMLTAAADTVDRVVGLELGADDYLPKPFDLRELLARVKSLQRRLGAISTPMPPVHALADPPSSHTGIAFGSCRLDLDAHTLRGPDGAEIPITAAEYDLLALFARAPNRPLNRDQIMEQAHKRGWDVFDRSIDLRVMRLRRKIERNPDKPEVIKTVRGVGYVFVSGGASGADS
ncbi:response regulator [Niveibacterium sp. SC-1]|uniref:response regulator n=1 Tax=Niveibacterium sp. SC-1 TaxID=3135646 RepID=UPI00311FB26E